MDNSLDVREKKELEEAMLEADSMIMKKYMYDITSYDVREVSQELCAIDTNSVTRLNRIEKLVYNADENNQDKLMNIYNAVGLCGGSIINLIVSDGKKVEYFVGTRAGDVNDISVCQSTLVNTMVGNFPGTKLGQQSKSELAECLQKVFQEERDRKVCFVSGIPGYKNQANKENLKYVQGIERIVDAMQGKKFALLTISNPLSNKQIIEKREGYEAMYSQLSPFAETQLTYSESDSDSIATTITKGMSKTISESVSKTVSNSSSSTTGVNRSKSITGTVFGSYALAGIGGGVSVSKGYTSGTNNSNTIQNGTSHGNVTGSSEASSVSNSDTDTYSSTSGRSLQITFENKAVKNLLNKINESIERIEQSTDLGLWNTATYCIADDTQTCRVLGNAMEALCRGEVTSIESFVVDTWNDSRKNATVKEYLRRFVHPEIIMQGKMNVYNITPASVINGKEMVVEAGLPQKSIPGLAVSEMVSFSRNIVCEESDSGEKIKLGNIYHMGMTEDTEVCLDMESIASHVLITGSTGAGKSNTVYMMLSELVKNDKKFLVIEPAKGEYKNVFGNRNDVNVYGTNPKVMEMLRINPFSFPEEIHVLEHVDRLVEIFNVCWPMYAAMPAVLKDAILQAYRKCGWNLETSTNELKSVYYPTFYDLQKQIIDVIEKSAYSEDTKGDYVGSLVTRVNSLTNGLNGLIFSKNELSSNKLFDENVIVDLSRVGSQETKSLIMGILVMKLNEYRVSMSNGKMNQKLKHVSVLEEAHNILKNHSRNEFGEGGNLLGKSVEMISNSIAEMRTYGEGFIIVDQSPSALDSSAIRNTNTKIIMRLPEQLDREKTGKSAALSNKQISELAKLPKGVAAVYQNNWLDAVLCKVQKAPIEEKMYRFKNESALEDEDIKATKKMIAMLLIGNRMDETVNVYVEQIKSGIDKIRLSAETQMRIEDVIIALEKDRKPEIFSDDKFSILSEIVCEVVRYDNIILGINSDMNVEDIQSHIGNKLRYELGEISKELELSISQCLIRKYVSEEKNGLELYEKWREYAVEQRGVM